MSDVATLDQADAPEPIFSKRITHTDTGLIFSSDTTFEEWQEAYAFYDRLHERGKWWLGDVIRYAEGRWPDRYTQAIELTGLSYSRLTTIVSICTRIEQPRRRKELNFGMHELVAYLPYQKADYLLDRAIKEHWTRDELADAVARANGQPTKAEKQAAKKNGTAKSLPQAAKPAPTIDVAATVTPQQPQPEAPAQPSKPAETPAATTQPKPEPSPTAPASAPKGASQLEPNQALALERSEAAFNIWSATIPTIDWEALSPLTKKRWLNKILIEADTLIDRIQKTLP